MTASDIRKQFFNFFSRHPALPHVRISSSTLIPANDTSVLFTSAGMQQFKSYFLGEKKKALQEYHSTRFTSVQKCFRVSDIDEVGDTSHLTFFEMLGNFSIGDYFAKEAISLAWEFITKKLKCDPQRLWATFFSGDKNQNIAADNEARIFWNASGMSNDHIFPCGIEANFWGPTGLSGPCGPSSELHYDLTQVPCERGEKCKPNCICGRFVEIWNIVFMMYEKDIRGRYHKLTQKNIDTGMGLERIAQIIEDTDSVFSTTLFKPILSSIEKDCGFGTTLPKIPRIRIAADHLRATVFLLADDIQFGKKAQEAVLRRIFRKALNQFENSQINLKYLVHTICKSYAREYPELLKKEPKILDAILQEFNAFKQLKEKNVAAFLIKIRHKKTGAIKVAELEGASQRFLTPKEAATLFTTHGFTLEHLQQEGYSFDADQVAAHISTHKEVSKKGAENKFGGHGLDTIHNETMPKEVKLSITKLHTATHLLLAALKNILDSDISQDGSDITPERLRFDFKFPRKLTENEKKKIEDLVNSVIKRNFSVIREEMPLADALAKGANAYFREKYPPIVNVYSIIEPELEQIFSIELCGGPHVHHTNELGTFKIQAEKSASKGVRRIKATLGDTPS